MEEIEDSFDSSVTQEHFFSSPKGDLSSTNATTCRSLNQEEACSSRHLSDSIADPINTVKNNVQDNLKQVLSPVQKTTKNSPGVSDHSVPCSQPEMTISSSSPVGLVPTRNKSTPTQLQQELNLLPETEDVRSENEAPCPSDSSYVGYQLMKYVSGESRGNYHFEISQDQDQGSLSDEDFCDASELQSISNAANAFNQQYQDKREEDESFTTTDSFSPEAFFSSVPLFKKFRKKRPAAIRPKPNITDPCSSGQYEHSDQYCSYLTGSHGVPILPKNKPNITVLMHDSNQGVPIAPRPDPNTKVSCYVLVVPAPVYYETFVPQENLQLQQEQEEDMSVNVPSEPQEDKITEIETTPEVNTQLQIPEPATMHPPDWTPKPPKPARTPLPSTRVRVSPSPHKGSNRCSPVITVSTTTTPIQPLQGNTQQYVIVQGNHRHLKGLASYKDSFCTPTVEESHQPIYLQGLPPQGFRRLWKAKENTCTERPTKRSLEPLFSKASASTNQEATVPQMEKSPLTCIRDKAPCDREVPEPDTSMRLSPDQRLLTEETLDVSTSSAAIEEISGQDTDTADVTEPESREDNEQPLESENEKIDEVTITPISHVKGGEDKERKKIRDRKYDANLKKAFEQLRRVVPRMQKSYSRGLILQETIKYIGILENKIVDAGLWSSIQTQDRPDQNTLSKSVSEEMHAKVTQEAESLLSPMTDTVPDICSSIANTLDETPTMLRDDGRGLNPHENATAALTSPIILTLSTEEGSCSFVSADGAVVTFDCEDPGGDTVMIEEVPLSIPFQQIQFLSVDSCDATAVLTPQSPDEPLSQEPHPRLIPVIEVPGYTESDDHSGMSHGGHICPHGDVFLSAMTTISPEGLNDLGVTLSPLLSPLGILLSPGGDHNQESTFAVVVEGASAGVEENVVVSSGVVPGVCTDMTSIAASVEVTTDQRKKWTPPSNGRTRRSPRLRVAQMVPSLSPLQADDSKPSSPHNRNRRVLQDQSNFEVARSPVAGNGRGRRRKSKDGSPEQSLHDTNENSAFAASQSRTPPGRVSGVILSGRRKTPSSRGGVDTKRLRRF